MPVIEAGESQKVNIPFDYFKSLLTTGEYRVRHTFFTVSREENKEPVRIAAEFKLTE